MVTIHDICIRLYAQASHCELSPRRGGLSPRLINCSILRNKSSSLVSVPWSPKQLTRRYGLITAASKSAIPSSICACLAFPAPGQRSNTTLDDVLSAIIIDWGRPLSSAKRRVRAAVYPSMMGISKSIRIQSYGLPSGPMAARTLFTASSPLMAAEKGQLGCVRWLNSQSTAIPTCLSWRRSTVRLIILSSTTRICCLLLPPGVGSG